MRGPPNPNIMCRISFTCNPLGSDGHPKVDPIYRGPNSGHYIHKRSATPLGCGVAMGTYYGQLDLGERIELFRHHDAGTAPSEIARIMGRQPSTIGRELKRNSLPRAGYKPASADRMAFSRRRRSSRIERLNPLRDHVDDHLAMVWSPEQIAGRPGAPAMWPTCLCGHGMAANRPAIDRICLRATVRQKQVAYDTDQRHSFRVGKASRGKSRLIPAF